MSAEASIGPLEGIRVLDLTAVVSGPLAAMILGDQGADVIKVEPPEVGDITRPMGTHRDGLSAIYASVNRNKRSLAIDLNDDEGRGLFLKLAETADVVMQNFRPGAVDRMGVGYEAVSDLNPDVIYVSIAGFGHDGPHARRGVYDPLIQAASGIAWAQGQEPSGDGRPQLVRSIVCDKVTGLTAAQAITAALFARERGAGGQHVKLSMLDAAVAFHWCDLMWRHTFVGDGVTMTPELADMFEINETADGHVIFVAAASDANFRAFCEALDKPELADDPRFGSLIDRMMNVAELRAFQAERAKRFTSDELCARLDGAGVPCSKVNTLEGMLSDPQVQHNGIVTQVEQPVGGTLRVAGPAADFPSTPSTIRRVAPGLGEHNAEILGELGVSIERVGELRERGVLSG